MKQKLLKKDIYALITNLQSGEYLKGTRYLVSQDRMHFCCLGVWADQHGATWQQDKMGEWIPIPKGRTRPLDHQETSNLHGKLAYGLTAVDQNTLAGLNDSTEDWIDVIDYLVHTVLPTAE